MTTERKSWYSFQEDLWRLLCRASRVSLYRFLMISFASMGICVGCAGIGDPLARADSFFLRGDCSKASEIWEKVARNGKGDSSAVAYFGLSQCELEQGNVQLAYSYAARAVARAQAPRNEWTRQLADTAYLLSKEDGIDLDSLVALTSTAIVNKSKFSSHARSDRARAYSGLGIRALEAGQPGKAISFLDKALVDEPRSVEFRRIRSDSYCELGRRSYEGGALRVALEQVNQALADNEGNRDARRLRVDVFHHMGLEAEERSRLAQAREFYIGALEDEPEHLEVIKSFSRVAIALGLASQEDDDHAAALASFDEALKYQPDLRDAILGKARSHFEVWWLAFSSGRTGDFQHLYKTLAALEDVRHSRREQFLLYRALAHSEFELGNWEKTRFLAREALKRYSEDLNARADLRKLRARASYELAGKVALEENYATAEEVLEEALRLDPTLASQVALRRAENYALQFHFEEAIRYATEAYQDTNSREVRAQARYDLARYMSIVGRPDEAMRYLVEFYPDPEDYQKVRKKAAGEDDFYNLKFDRRFQTWLVGAKRARFRVHSAEIRHCEDMRGTAGLCDPFVILMSSNGFQEFESTHFKDEHFPIWSETASHVADFVIDQEYIIEIRDLDPEFSENDLIGMVPLNKSHLLFDDSYREQLVNNGRVVGYVTFSIEATDTELGSLTVLASPSESVVGWPILGCFAKLGINIFPQIGLIKDAIKELIGSFVAKNFSIYDALKKFTSVSLKRVVNGLAFFFSVSDFVQCIEEYRHQFLDRPQPAH